MQGSGGRKSDTVHIMAAHTADVTKIEVDAKIADILERTALPNVSQRLPVTIEVICYKF